jgi:ribonuclease P protein component
MAYGSREVRLALADLQLQGWCRPRGAFCVCAASGRAIDIWRDTRPTLCSTVETRRDAHRAGRGPVEHERHVERMRFDQHLRRGQRLRSPRDFRRAHLHGRRASGTLVTLTSLRQVGEPASARVGVVAGKRVGGAVVRNRVKRRLREVLRRELPGIPAGWDLVCGAKPAAATATSAALAAEVRGLLARTGLLAQPAVLSEDHREATASAQPPSLAPGSRKNRSKQQ